MTASEAIERAIVDTASEWFACDPDADTAREHFIELLTEYQHADRRSFDHAIREINRHKGDHPCETTSPL